MKKTTKNQIRPDQIKGIVNTYFGFDIAASTRLRPYVDARFMYAALCRKYTNCSLSEIGKHVGRDHSTVLYGTTQCHTIAQYNSIFKEKFEILDNLVREFKEQPKKKHLTRPKKLHPGLLRYAKQPLRQILNKRR